MNYLFETERLRFRDMHARDAEKLFELNSDPDVVRYTGDGAFDSVETVREFIEERLEFYRKAGYGRWICELKSSGEIIGWCGLKFHDNTEETDVGYRLFKKYWGNGYATEATKAAIDFGFSAFNLSRIIAHARKENIASLKVLEKCGMKIIGETKEDGEEIVVFEIPNY